MRANVKFNQLPRPVPLPKVDPVTLTAWWAILALTVAFWYWIGSIIGIVG